MWVMDQKGKNTYDLSKAVYFSLEDKTEEMVKFHPAYHGKVNVIRLHYSADNPNIYKTLACFQNEEDAMACYKEFVTAMASGCAVFDFSGMAHEMELELKPEAEKNRGEW